MRRTLTLLSRVLGVTALVASTWWAFLARARPVAGIDSEPAVRTTATAERQVALVRIALIVGSSGYKHEQRW